MHSSTTQPSAAEILIDDGVSDERAESLQELWRSLHVLCTAWRAQSNRMAAEFGLSSPQFTVFTVLSTRAAMTMGQIGEQSDLPTSSLTALVDRLVALGLASREAHPSDRRAIQVRLTEQGRELASQVADETIRATAQVTAGFADRQIGEASGAIRLLMDGYQQYVATLGGASARPLARRAGAGRLTTLDHSGPFHHDGDAHRDGKATIDHDGVSPGSSRPVPE